MLKLQFPGVHKEGVPDGYRDLAMFDSAEFIDRNGVPALKLNGRLKAAAPVAARSSIATPFASRTGTVYVRTDEKGDFSWHGTESAPFGGAVLLSGTLKEPATTEVTAKIVLQNSGGSQENDYVLKTEERASLGTWKVTSGSNELSIQGLTKPARPNSILKIELEFEFSLFG